MSPDQLQSCDSLSDSLLFMNHQSCDCGCMTSASANLCSELMVGPPPSAHSNAPARLQLRPNHTALHWFACGNPAPHSMCQSSNSVSAQSHSCFSSPLANVGGRQVLHPPVLFLEPLIPNSQVLHAVEPSAFIFWLASAGPTLPAHYQGASCQKSLSGCRLSFKTSTSQGKAIITKGQPFWSWRTRTKSVCVVSFGDVSLCLTWRLVTVSLRASSDGAMTGTR